MDRIPYREIRSLTFSIYRPHEIEKLSVLEITNPEAFDALELPTYGGLYDPRLGPSDQDEACHTCGLRAMFCPGHVGHISLPLPVFHPVFIKTLYQLLQGSCFSCRRLLAPTSIIQLAMYQFKALNLGLVGTVQELAEAIRDPALETSAASNSENVQNLIQIKLQSIIDDAVKDLDLKDSKNNPRVKSVVECRQRVMKEFIRNNLTKSKSQCSHCHEKKSKIALRYNSRFIYGTTKKSVKNQKEKTVQNLNLNEEIQNVEPQDESSHGNVGLTVLEIKEHLNLLWEKEKVLLQHLFGILLAESNTGKNPIDIFFIETLLVPPSRFRPIQFVKGRKYLNPQSVAFKDVLNDCITLMNLLKTMKGETVPDPALDQINKLPGKNYAEKLNHIWLSLQVKVNAVYDSDLDKLNKDKTSVGVKQVLEKKEGLFRKHMMGKRVNYAARSVISPDPYIMVDEIGVPMVFAKKLTYPTPVTSWNVEKLRMAVINGPDVHPGADKIEFESGKITKLSPTDVVQRKALAGKLLTPSTSSTGIQKGIPKKVYRHLQNGDVLLLNRQPTLHKPSIMAHRARVLPGEKTLRLHYANCKSYNADFDGDEMNAHYPQSELARSEGYNIVSVNHQYLVPKDGTPLSGLIQDHIIAGTLLTMRGRFFKKQDYQQLVFGAIAFLPKAVKTFPPCIMKPEELWSGKQLVSAVIKNVIPEGKPPPTVEGKAKIPSKNWQNDTPRAWLAGGTPLKGDSMSESEVIIHCGELLCGVIDKANIGPTPYGLIHCCNELYGGQTSSDLLTALARLFTHFLQIHSGFTLGIEDILLTAKGDRKRRKVMKKARKSGDEVVANAYDVEDGSNKSELFARYQEAHLNRDDTGLKALDFQMKKLTNDVNNDINGICMPNGLLKTFPQNNLQLMVQSGAKGTTVNTMQISCLLGQIELEGRRVPLMQNGSTLPSFLPYDTSPRAGGFVDGRFLTGIRPQEFFFHCMAGREGLVDTAVKTSRSGYLQRCLIKHLEGITVNYDLTVRDSDGSVLQFLYGEDSLDIARLQMLKAGKLHLLAKNYNAAMNVKEIEQLQSFEMADPTNHKIKIDKWKRKYGTDNVKTRSSPFLTYYSKISQGMSSLNDAAALVENWRHLDHDGKKKYFKRNKRCPDPVNSICRPDITFGSVSENLDAIIENYVENNFQNGKSSEKLSPEQFRSMVYYRAFKALIHPGEAVGLLAAQSIGEPSTQMTLNTFHFAGRGEMNVTLGIPRLREILMVASANIATPTMDLPLLQKSDITKEAEKLKVKLTSVMLKQVLEAIEIQEVVHVKGNDQRFRMYKVKMEFLPHRMYKGLLYCNPSSILDYVEKVFIQRLIVMTKKKLANISEASLVRTSSKQRKLPSATDENTRAVPVVDLDEGGTSDEGEGEGDTASTKNKNRHNQDLEYEEPEAEEKVDEPDEIEQDDENEVPKEQENDNELFESAEIISQQKNTENLEKISKIALIKHKYSWISEYDYDGKCKQWCRFTIRLCLQGSKIDMETLVQDEVNNAVLYSVKAIKRAFLVQNNRSDEKMLKTDGVNFLEIFNYIDIIDMTKIYSNDIHQVAKIYGIEAASRVIVKEITNVFATYGIEVDPRHLSLVAAYMTVDGTYKPFNRIGMESNASPLQQMTFETTMNFLQSAALTGSEDQLKSPSSKIIVGQLVGGGTGCFDLLLKNTLIPKKSI